MKTDSLFYRLFQIRPQLLFDLLATDLPPNISYDFTSVEVKQLSLFFAELFLYLYHFDQLALHTDQLKPPFPSGG